MSRSFLLGLGLSAAFFCADAATLPHPILFVTQVPTGYDNVNMTISAPFANHLPTTLAGAPTTMLKIALLASKKIAGSRTAIAWLPVSNPAPPGVP